MTSSRSGSSTSIVGLGAVLLVAGAATAGYAAFGHREVAQAATVPAAPTTPAVPTKPKPDPAAASARSPEVNAWVDQVIASKVTLVFDGKRVQTTWKELGATLDESAVGRAAARLAENGKPAGPAPIQLDRGKTLDVLVTMKDDYDRPSADARVDLVSKKVIPEVPGFGIDVYGSLAALSEAARAAATEVELAGGPIEPGVTLAKLGNLDISHVMGWFETKYPPGERDRNYNLRLVAEHVNGHIIMPGETFDFNGVVGDRTEKQGYRVAHVIQAGEMIDGLAGGACQISSTLNGAAWFAGLELVKSSPHSRPSAYVTMGMDATVVYPSVNLVLKNPYDFPVVIYYVVSQGTVRVEILGRKRPYDKIAFEREIKEEKPYETVARDDETLPLGTQIVEQMGFPGYLLERRRLFYKDGKEVKREKWAISYPPTTEYVRIGSNPDPNLVPPPAKEPHGPMPPGGKTYRLER